MGNFSSAYRRTAVYEGGYSNVKNDKGGETYKGISRVFHPEWKGWPIVDRYKPLKYGQIIDNSLLEQYVQEFYQEYFWNKVSGDQINNQVIAEFLYDYSVHSGVGRAVSKLQKALNFSISQQDGVMGNQTVSAVNNNDPKQLLDKIKQERINFLTYLSTQPGQAKFKNGWLSRVNNFKII